MRAVVIILANPYTYNFLKGLTHSAMNSGVLPSCTLPSYIFAVYFLYVTNHHSASLSGKLLICFAVLDNSKTLYC